MNTTLTLRHRRLAGHALGLPNRRNVSYRNRFLAPYTPGGDTDRWFQMVELGLAEAMPPVGNYIRFYLTRQGADAALDPGETLDPDDFPETEPTEGH